MRARIHNDGGDNMIVSRPNAAGHQPMLAAVIGAKHVAIGSADEQDLRAARHRRQGLDISALWADWPPVLGLRAYSYRQHESQKCPAASP
jgi:hypothetical protein